MKLLEAVSEAKLEVERCDDAEVAKWVLDTFSEDPECGIEPFKVCDGRVIAGDTNAFDERASMSVPEARAYAKALLVACDEAEHAGEEEFDEDLEEEEEDDFDNNDEGLDEDGDDEDGEDEDDEWDRDCSALTDEDEDES